MKFRGPETTRRFRAARKIVGFIKKNARKTNVSKKETTGFSASPKSLVRRRLSPKGSLKNMKKKKEKRMSRHTRALSFRRLSNSLRTTPTLKRRCLLIVGVQNGLDRSYYSKSQGDVEERKQVLREIRKLRKRLFDIVIHCKVVWPSNHVAFVTNNPGYKIGKHVVVEEKSHEIVEERCVESTHSAAFLDDLCIELTDHIIEISGNPFCNMMSSPFIPSRNSRNELTLDKSVQSGMCRILQRNNVEEVFIVGMGMEYSVQLTALHARQCMDTYMKKSSHIYVVTEACAMLKFSG